MTDPDPQQSTTRHQELECLELCPICRAADVLRASGAAEMRGGLDELGRDALIALRTVIDSYLERSEGQAGGGQRVERIPID